MVIMVAKNVASCKFNAQRDRFVGLSAPTTLLDVRNFNSFKLSDFIHANLSNNIKPDNYYDLNFQFDTFSDCKNERTFILHACNACIAIHLSMQDKCPLVFTV